MRHIFEARSLRYSAALLCMAGLTWSSQALTRPTEHVCDQWEPLPFVALNQLEQCGDAPVQRRIQGVCVRHEWLCGDSDFGVWFAKWAQEVDSPIRLELREGQMIFSSEHDNQAWAVFWTPASEPSQGFVLLLSRLRAAGSFE